MRQKPVVLIPAYDPCDGLVALLDALAQTKRFQAIVVVNDGSGADRQGLFERVQTIRDVSVLPHAVNLGKGAALKTGINHILCRYPDAAGIVTADADGQHLPTDIVAVADALVQRPDALILGVRAFTGEVPLRSRLGNSLTRLVFRGLVGYRLCDTQTGLRGIPRTLAPDLLRIRANGYDFELDMLIRARESGVAVIQVPIETVYEDDNAASHFNPVFDSLRIYFVFLRYLFASLVTTAVSLVAFDLSFRLTGHLLLSEAALRVVGTIVQFSLDRGPVFKYRDEVFTAFVKFVALVIVMGVAAYWMTLGFVAWLGVDVIWGRILAAILLYVPAFAVQRDFVFSKGPSSSPTLDRETP